jgi:hypothetical protein
MKVAILLGAFLALTSCGAAGNLKPPPGKTLPVAPYGAKATPSPRDLLTPSSQSRPARTDDLLSNSTERRSDEFDLPPSD